jgi:hypothetical protein
MNNNPTRAALLGIIVVCCLCTRASLAGVTWTAQHREVECDVTEFVTALGASQGLTPQSISNHASAPDFQPFNVSFSASGASASQNSTITANAVNARGTLNLLPSFHGNLISRDYFGFNFCSVNFNLSEPADYTLIYNPINGAFPVNLQSSTTVVMLNPPPSTTPVTYTGRLAAGSWEIGPQGGTYDFSFALAPEPSSLALSGLGLITILRRKAR